MGCCPSKGHSSQEGAPLSQRDKPKDNAEKEADPKTTAEVETAPKTKAEDVPAAKKKAEEEPAAKKTANEEAAAKKTTENEAAPKTKAEEEVAVNLSQQSVSKQTCQLKVENSDSPPAVVFLPSVAALIGLRSLGIGEDRARLLLEREQPTAIYVLCSEELEARYEIHTENLFRQSATAVSQLYGVCASCYQDSLLSRADCMKESNEAFRQILSVQEGYQRQNVLRHWCAQIIPMASDLFERIYLCAAHTLDKELPTTESISIEFAEGAARYHHIQNPYIYGFTLLLEELEEGIRLEWALRWVSSLSDFSQKRAELDKEHKQREKHRAAYFADLAGTMNRRRKAFEKEFEKERDITEKHLLREHGRALTLSWNALEQSRCLRARIDLRRTQDVELGNKAMGPSAFDFAVGALSRDVTVPQRQQSKAASHALRIEDLRARKVDRKSTAFVATAAKTREEIFLAELDTIRNDRAANTREAQHIHRAGVHYLEYTSREAIEREETHTWSSLKSSMERSVIPKHTFLARREGLTIVPKQSDSPPTVKASPPWFAGTEWAVRIPLLQEEEQAARNKFYTEFDSVATALGDMKRVAHATVMAHDRRRAGHAARRVDHKGAAAVKIQKLCRGWGVRWQVRAWRDMEELALLVNHERMQRKYLRTKEDITWHEMMHNHEGFMLINDRTYCVQHTLDYIEEDVRKHTTKQEAEAFLKLLLAQHNELEVIRRSVKPIEVLDPAARCIQRIWRGHYSRSQRTQSVGIVLRLQRAKREYYGVSRRLVVPVEVLHRARMEEEVASFRVAMEKTRQDEIQRRVECILKIQKHWRRYIQQKKYNRRVESELEEKVARLSVNKMTKNVT